MARSDRFAEHKMVARKISRNEYPQNAESAGFVPKHTLATPSGGCLPYIFPVLLPPPQNLESFSPVGTAASPELDPLLKTLTLQRFCGPARNPGINGVHRDPYDTKVDGTVLC
jgi:hypothetical protein